MFRKITALLVAALFLFQTAVFAAAGEMTVMEKLAAVETKIYGTVQTGSLLERVDGVEKELYGKISQGAVVSRSDELHDAVFNQTGAQPSFMMQINAVEWKLQRSLTYDAIKTRLENLETIIYGGPKEGCLNDRMQALTELAFPSGRVTVADKIVPANSLLHIKLVEALDSRTAKVGDTVKYQAVKDVIIDGVLIVAQGEKGEGKITKVKQNQNFGRDAQVEIDFGSIEAIDGSRMEVFMGEEAENAMKKSLAMAAGASLAGVAILGPIGIVGGAFVKGKPVELSAGTEMYVQTKDESVVYGFDAGML